MLKNSRKTGRPFSETSSLAAQLTFSKMQLTQEEIREHP